jgi:spore germination protein GerM
MVFPSTGKIPSTLKISSEASMRKLLLFALMTGIILACNLTTPGAVSPTAGITSAPTIPEHFETNSVMPTLEKFTGVTETLPPGSISVSVYFTLANDNDMTPVPVARVIPYSDNLATVIHSTLKELLKGPTDAEKTQGLTSWFSSATAHSATGVMLVSDIDLTVDFTGLNTLIPNASTSAGSQMLLSQLNSTVFQFESVQTVHYTLDGDCAAFWEWLQFECHPVTRVEWEKGVGLLPCVSFIPAAQPVHCGTLLLA